VVPVGVARGVRDSRERVGQSQAERERYERRQRKTEAAGGHPQDFSAIGAQHRSFRRWLAAITAAGMALRVAYVLLVSERPEAGVGAKRLLGEAIGGRGDTFFFHNTANLLAEGRGFSDPFVFLAQGRLVPTGSHPPLFSLVLAIVSKLGGTSYLAHQLAGAVLGAVTVALVGLIGRRVGGPRVGLIAALVAAVYPVLVSADGALMSEALYGALIAGALLLGFRLADRGDRLSALALGVVIGLAALTRTEALLLVPLLGLPLALRGSGGRAARAVLVCAGCALALLPWTLRNLSAFERPLLVTSNDGTVLAGANCPATYSGIDVGAWRFDCISARRTADDSVQGARWRSEGLDYAREHAGELPRVLAVRLLRTWDFFQPRRQVRFAEGRPARAQQLATGAYYLLLPLAIAGAVLLRRRPLELALLLCPALLVSLASLLGYGLPRFRHAAELSIVVLAAAALAAILAACASRWRASPGGSPSSP